MTERQSHYNTISITDLSADTAVSDLRESHFLKIRDEIMSQIAQGAEAPHKDYVELTNKALTQSTDTNVLLAAMSVSTTSGRDNAEHYDDFVQGWNNLLARDDLDESDLNVASIIQTAQTFAQHIEQVQAANNTTQQLAVNAL